jgi:hypothetical protein
VEAVAVLPFLLIAVLAAAQIGLVGQALWSAGVAARAGARAAAVGRDPRVSARRALPASMRPDAEVTASEGVSVRVPVPRLLPLPEGLAVEAGTALEDGDG